MHYDMRPDRVGWTLFDVTTGRPVVWDDVPLTGVDLDAAHELLVLLHRKHRLRPQEACRRIPDKGSGSFLVAAESRRGPPTNLDLPSARAPGRVGRVRRPFLARCPPAPS